MRRSESFSERYQGIARVKRTQLRIYAGLRPARVYIAKKEVEKKAGEEEEEVLVWG